MRKRVLRTIAETRMYYGLPPMPDTVLRLQDQDLSDIEEGRVLAGYEIWRKTNSRCPTPADIRKTITGTDEDLARVAAAKCLKCVSRYGYSNAVGAKKEIGPIGWEAVTLMYGSWKYFCQNLNTSQVPMVMAQLRDLCGSLIRQARSSGDDIMLSNNLYKPAELEHKANKGRS